MEEVNSAQSNSALVSMISAPQPLKPGLSNTVQVTIQGQCKHCCTGHQGHTDTDTCCRLSDLTQPVVATKHVMSTKVE